MKPSKSLTRSAVGLVMPTPRLAPSNVSISQETLEHMRQCEAREWMSRYEKKAIELGSGNAQSWCQGVKNEIAIENKGGSGDSASLVINDIDEIKNIPFHY